MDRSNNSRMSTPKLGLVMTTALASVALTGCTASVAPQAQSSVSKAQVALEKGQGDKAVSHAEAAVLSEPRNGEFRAMLGAAYLEAGRFEAAATSFSDAMELGNEDPRTVLSQALALVATGKNKAALVSLRKWETNINAADLGLALALAGDPQRGVHILTNSLRSGQNTAKVRQNLAYTYALAGNWPAARVMAAEDVPPGELDARLSQWASTASPEQYQVRVASLLGVTPVDGGGQPRHLALANFPSQEMMVAEAAAQAPERLAVAAPAVETAAATPSPVRAAPTKVARSQPSSPTVAKIMAATAPKSAPMPVARKVDTAVPAAKPVRETTAKPGRRFVSNAVVQTVPEKAVKPAAKPAAKKAPARVAKSTSQRRMAVATGKSDTHLVQLGSFSSREVAEVKWAEFQRKFVDLKGRDVVITEAKVKGKTFFRVAAAGFGSKSARAMCGAAKSKGVGCFAYAASSPPAGAVDRGVRIAARTR